MLTLGTNYHYDTDAKRFINTKHQRIAEILHDYNPELSLMWIPPENRDAEDVKPYVVVHSPASGGQYPVFYLSEDELDERVIARIFEADMSKHRPNDALVALEAQDAARQIMIAKQYEDEKAEARDLAKHVLRSPLNVYRHNGREYR